MNVVAEKKIENYDLIVQAKEGSEEAMERLIKVYDNFLWKEVKRIAKNKQRQQDLYQVGAMALIESVPKFDLSSGNEFITFLYMRVRGKMMVSLREGRAIKTPTSLVDLSVKIRKEDLTHESAKYISEQLEVSIDKVEDALLYMERENPTSTDSVVFGFGSSDNTETTVGDLIRKDVNGDDWESMVELHYYINQLPEREKYVITERYINDKQQGTVGKTMNIKQQSVARIEYMALENLRSLMSGNGLIVREDNRGKHKKPATGNHGMAKELLRKGELSQVQISKLTGVPTGTIGYWKSKLKKGQEI